MFCPWCGSGLEEGAAFCGKCGRRAAQVPSVVAPPSIPPDQARTHIGAVMTEAAWPPPPPPPPPLAPPPPPTPRSGSGSGGSHWRRRWLAAGAAVILVVSATLGYLIVGGSGSPAPLDQIVFLSDQSVVLPTAGATYQFAAEVVGPNHVPVPEPLRWVSQDPAEVAVTSTGEVLARVGEGSTSVFVSAAGAQSQAAQVAVTQPAPDTVLVPSQDVKALGATSVTLTLTPQISDIHTGEILVSGSSGGLLAKVVSITRSGTTLHLTTTEASLAEAFPHMSVTAQTPPFTFTLGPAAQTSSDTTNGTAQLLAALVGGQSAQSPALLPALDSATPTCQRQAGTSVSMTVSAPSASVHPTAHLVAHFTASPLSFLLELKASLPLTVTSGALTLSAAGDADVTCTWDLASIEMPVSLWIAPIDITGLASAQASVGVQGHVDGRLTVNGPTATETVQATDGIQYTGHDGWSAIDQNTASAPLVTPEASSFDAGLSAGFTASLRFALGVSASLGDCSIGFGPFHACLTLGQGNFLFAQGAANLQFQLATPLAPMAAGYAGPSWKADLELTAGPELSFSGVIPDLLSYVGINLPNVQWNLFDDTIPLAGSPAIATTVSGGTMPGSADVLKAVVPTGYAGDTVEFVAYPKSDGQGAMVATATVAGTSAVASWTVGSELLDGDTIGALLVASPFGATLPYSSAGAAVVSSPSSPSGEATPGATASSRPSASATPKPSGSDLLPPQCAGGAACVITADGLTIIVVQTPYRQSCSPCGGIPGLNVEVYLRFTYAGSGQYTVDDENDGNGSWTLVDDATGGRVIQWEVDSLFGCIGADQQAQAAGIGGNLEDELLALPGANDCFSATLQSGTCFTVPVPMVWFIEGSASDKLTLEYTDASGNTPPTTYDMNLGNTSGPSAPPSSPPANGDCRS